MVGCASVSVWVQAGQCAGMAARPGQRLLVAMNRKAVVTAMQAALPKTVHAWREEVLQTAMRCDASCIHTQHVWHGCSVHWHLYRCSKLADASLPVLTMLIE